MKRVFAIEGTTTVAVKQHEKDVVAALYKHTHIHPAAKVDAIKFLRAQHNLGLKDAKDICDLIGQANTGTPCGRPTVDLERGSNKWKYEFDIKTTRHIELEDYHVDVVKRLHRMHRESAAQDLLVDLGLSINDAQAMSRMVYKGDIGVPELLMDDAILGTHSIGRPSRAV